MLELARLAQSGGDHVAAVDWLERAQQAAPQALAPRLALTEELLAQGAAGRALLVAQEALRIAPQDPAVLEVLGRTQLAINDYATAQRTLQTLVHLQPNRALPHLRLAQALDGGGDRQGAVRSLRQALDLDPNLDEARNLWTKWVGGDKATAEVAAEPHSPTVYCLQGDMSLRDRDYRRAAEAYGAALSLAPDRETLFKLTEALRQGGQWEQARQRLEEWLAKRERDLEVRLVLAELLRQQGEREAAIAQYEHLLRLQPDHRAALNGLNDLYQETSPELAVGFAERAYRLAPTDPVQGDRYGWSLVRTGRVERGIYLLQEVYRRASYLPQVRYHIAEALNRLGKRDAARKELEGLLRGGYAFAEEEQARTLLRQLEAKQ
jgi:putative PEP-CTERM system TPR-repeat lipoprotein